MGLCILATVGAYVLGSIPFGLIVAKLLGTTDPRASGSKNIGFTNVLRVSGKAAGFLTLFGDLGKGIIVIFLANSSGIPWNWVLLIGLAVILGHIFSVFLKFRGGKGVATALGAVVGIDPLIGLCLVGIWIAMVIIFRYSSGGALGAFVAFPVVTYIEHPDFSLLLFSLSVLVLIGYSHKENIIRLSQGTESKMSLLSS